MSSAWIVAKSTTLATLVLLGVSKKWGHTPTSHSTGYLIHNNPMPRPLSRAPLVPTVSWIHNILWIVVWRPLSRVPKRHEARPLCLDKRVHTELVRYPGLNIIVVMPSSCHKVRTYKVILLWFTISAWEILEDYHMNPWLSDLSIRRSTTGMLHLISSRGVVKTCDLMCASPLLHLL
jgi:hypothetical protein